ncbi:MAG: GNAT family N-acetyltransferase [Clostridium butyricum]|nr:GNAT family N-acetyltransferase [Clostridium butyricum]
MCIYEIKNKKSLEKLAEGWDETLIWSYLQGYMGTAYTNNIETIESVQIVVGDFCFFLGEPKEEIVNHKPEFFKSDFIIMVAKDEGWSELIEKVYSERAVKRERYAIKKETHSFDKEKLKITAETLEKSYEVKMIDEKIYNQIMNNKWSMDLCSQFKDYKDYKLRGIGTAVLKDGEIVSGASSYTVYNGGIEIEIDTRRDERRKGLASVCAAKLILECLDRNLYPSWDAQNKWSLALAEKLGYHFFKAYPVYEVNNY